MNWWKNAGFCLPFCQTVLFKTELHQVTCSTLHYLPSNMPFLFQIYVYISQKHRRTSAEKCMKKKKNQQSSTTLLSYIYYKTLRFERNNIVQITSYSCGDLFWMLQPISEFQFNHYKRLLMNHLFLLSFTWLFFCIWELKTSSVCKHVLFEKFSWGTQWGILFPPKPLHWIYTWWCDIMFTSNVFLLEETGIVSIFSQ